MNFPKRVCWLFAISVLTCGALCGQVPAVKSCKLTIAPVTPAIASGAEARAQITLTNTSSGDITIPRVMQPGYAETHYALEVTNEKGQPTPPTAMGRWLKMPFAGAGSYGFAVVKPGESFKEEIVITKLYDITLPGKYILQVTGQWPDIGLVKSNTATIVVTP